MSKKTAIVIGTGAGGSMIAKELQGDFQVTMLEAGGNFKPFSFSVKKLSGLRKTRLFLDERLIQLLLPNMKIRKTRDMVLVYGEGVGGTTTLATGNAVRYDKDLQKLGISLEEEYKQLEKELPITTEHKKYWNRSTRRMYRIFQKMGLDPIVTPKLLNPEACIRCGHCAIGCPVGAKWNTIEVVKEAAQKGAELLTGYKVTKFEIAENRVKKIYARKNGRTKVFEADVIILAAGGLGTPVILNRSGIPCESTLFVDPVLCVAAPVNELRQDRQLLMPFISQQEGYILSPYMDYLSFFFHKDWRKHSMRGFASIMIKMADEEKGWITEEGIQKDLTEKDREILKDAVAKSKEILKELGARESEMFLGTVNAGHPGGMLPLREEEKDTLHSSRLPDNLYIADATILPKAMGNPPMLTIMALSKKIASKIKESFL